jgi:hypothetical protein
MIHEKIPDSQLQEWDVEGGGGKWGREFYKSTSQFEPCIYVRKVNTGKFLLKEKEVFTRLFAKKFRFAIANWWHLAGKRKLNKMLRPIALVAILLYI